MVEAPPRPVRRSGAAFVLAGAAALPGVFVHLGGLHPEPLLAAAIFGFAIVGSAFMLAWAAEVAREEPAPPPHRLAG